MSITAWWNSGTLTVTGLNPGAGIAVSGDTVSVENSGVLLPAHGGTGVATLTGLAKGNGASVFTAAASGTDYAPATSGSGLLKGNGSGGFSTGTAGTDYVAPGGALGTPASGTLTNCTFPTLNQGTTGNAATATKWATPRKVNGVSLDGTADIKVYPSTWQPEDSSLIAWNYDPVATFQGQLLSAGLVYLITIPIRVATTISNIIVNVYAAGSGLTSGQCLAGLYQGTTLLSTTADQSAVWNSTGTKTMALGSSQAVTAGIVYVALCVNFATTSPSFSAPAASFASIISIPGRFGYDATHTGRTTSLPNPIATPTDLPALPPIWAAVS